MHELITVNNTSTLPSNLPIYGALETAIMPYSEESIVQDNPMIDNDDNVQSWTESIKNSVWDYVSIIGNVEPDPCGEEQDLWLIGSNTWNNLVEYLNFYD